MNFLASRTLSVSIAVDPLLRSANAQDLDRLLELDRLCFGKLWSADQYLREIESPNSDLIVAVHPEAEIAPSEIAPSTTLESEMPLLAYGCVWAIVDEAHLTILGTHPDCQHRGYGRKVLIKLLHQAIDRGMKRATLEVRSSNAAALHLYQSLDFEIAGCRKKYYSNPEEDALILWKGGLQTPIVQQTLGYKTCD